ncbi:MAG: hypothetical protein IKR29_06775 [Bacteroidales bacterium]|nr:hypothetical protein [Bacteroidales bacterium]
MAIHHRQQWIATTTLHSWQAKLRKLRSSQPEGSPTRGEVMTATVQ